MMIREDCGQISLEYILIFTVFLIILMVFTLPLAEESVKNTLDVSDYLNAKSDLSKIAQAIKQVYGEGQGSRHTIRLDDSKRIKINIKNSHLSTNFKFRDNSKKEIRESVSSNIKETSLTLNKGENTLIVEWPVNSKNMLIYSV